MTDDRLERLFTELKAEDRRRTPQFARMMAEAREAAGVEARGGGRQRKGNPGSRWWWQALPLGTGLAAAGLGAIALFGGPSASEATFRDAVEWAGSFATVGVPSDALLEAPEWALWKTTSPSGGLGSGLSDLLDLERSINDERNNS